MPTQVPSAYHIGVRSYTDDPTHSEGGERLFHIDAHHYYDSNSPYDVISTMSDEMNSWTMSFPRLQLALRCHFQGDSWTVDDETVHAQVEVDLVDLNRVPKMSTDDPKGRSLTSLEQII